MMWLRVVVAVLSLGAICVPDPPPNTTRTATTTSTGTPGRFLRKWPPIQLHGPRGVAIDATDRVYVADTGANRIIILAPDHTLIKTFGSEGSGSGQFDNPSSVAVDDAGRLYVVDTNNDRVQYFTTDGAYLGQFGSHGTGDGQFDRPVAVALGPVVSGSRRVYVVDRDNDRVQYFDADGVYQGQLAADDPVDIDVDAAGHPYVVLQYTQQVRYFSADGALLGAFGSSGHGDGELYYPTGVAVTADGRVYVADGQNYRIEYFTGDGTYLGQFGARGNDAGEFTGAVQMDEDGAGRLYVADIAGRIQVFSHDGTYLEEIGSYGSQPGYLQVAAGVAVDPCGDVFVSDFNGDHVNVYGPDGTYLRRFGSEGAAPGQIDEPMGIALSRDGRVYVADLWNDRVDIFSTSGDYQSQFGTFGSGDGQFHWPAGVAIGPTGRVYVADSANYRVQYFTADGAYLGQFGSLGTNPGDFYRIEHIAVSRTGRVYVADTILNRVQYFTADGTYLGVLDTSVPGLGLPRGVAVDDSGNVYVSDNTNDKVLYFTADGAYLGQFGSSGVDDGQFRYATGVFVANGEIFVADGSRIQVFEALGPTGGPAPTFGLSDVYAESPDGSPRTVTFPETATDPGVGPLTATCSPASGSVFDLGATPVTCTVTDADENSAETTFQVIVTTSVTRAGSGTVTRVGGSVTTSDGTVRIDVPAGATAFCPAVSLAEAGSELVMTNGAGERGRVLYRMQVDVKPEGEPFDPAAVLSLGWSDADDDGIIDGTHIHEADLVLTHDGATIPGVGRCADTPGPVATTGYGCDTALNTFEVAVTGPGQWGLALFDLEPPAVRDLAFDPDPAPVSTPIVLTATADDSQTGGTPIGSVEYAVDGGAWAAMSPADGAFDDDVEGATATLAGFATVGLHSVCVRAADVLANAWSAPQCALLVVYDAAAGFVTGGGNYTSPAGAYVADAGLSGKATFGFVVKYLKGATRPTGQAQVQIHCAKLNFHGDAYDWLVVSSPDAWFAGTGTLNGVPGYDFLMSVTDGGPSCGADRIRVQITKDGAPVYDTMPGAEVMALPATSLDGGSIVIHGG